MRLNSKSKPSEFSRDLVLCGSCQVLAGLLCAARRPDAVGRRTRDGGQEQGGCLQCCCGALLAIVGCRRSRGGCRSRYDCGYGCGCGGRYPCGENHNLLRARPDPVGLPAGERSLCIQCARAFTHIAHTSRPVDRPAGERKETNLSLACISYTTQYTLILWYNI